MINDKDKTPFDYEFSPAELVDRNELIIIAMRILELENGALLLKKAFTTAYKGEAKPNIEDWKSHDQYILYLRLLGIDLHKQNEIIDHPDQPIDLAVQGGVDNLLKTFGISEL